MRTKQLLLIGLIIAALAIAGCSQPPEDLAKADIQTSNNPSAPAEQTSGEWKTINKAASAFEFEGYAPGKSHLGTFQFYEGELLIKDGEVIAARGTIDASSVKSDGERLEEHLRSEDFFNTATYPEITFTSTSIAEGVMTGDLTFIGVTNKVSFPVTIEGESITADFLLDTTPYGMKYVGVNKEVRIGFMMTT